MKIQSFRNAVFLAFLSSFLSPFAVADDSPAKNVDSLLIKAQKICPVSGVTLGEHGEPVKAILEGKTVFLCCDGCMGKSVNEGYTAQIAANQMAAQKKCPVMGKDLKPGDSSTVVNGRTLFVCCPPCIKKIQADPDKFIGKVDEMLSQNLASSK